MITFPWSSSTGKLNIAFGGMHTYVLTIKKSKGIIKYTVEVMVAWGLGNGMKLRGTQFTRVSVGLFVFLELGDGYTVVPCIDVLYNIFYKYAFVSTWYLIKTIFNNCLQKIYENQVPGLKSPGEQLSPMQSCPQDTTHAPCEPYLGGVERCDDPHTVCIVVILNGEIGGGDDARGASKVGITHAGCREETEDEHFSLDEDQSPSHLPAPAQKSLKSVHRIPDKTFYFLFPSSIAPNGLKRRSQSTGGRGRPHIPWLAAL